MQNISVCSAGPLHLHRVLSTSTSPYNFKVTSLLGNAVLIHQAGLNLNLFGALSGALSSTKRKETHSKPDGSKHTIEDSHDKGASHLPSPLFTPSRSLPSFSLPYPT